MAKAREIRGLSATQPFGDAARRIVEIRAQELVAHGPGVLNIADIERVHDMRVATRRLRAALEVFEACFPSKPFRRTIAELKVLADALGERRDLDVAIASLKAFSSTLSAPDRAGVHGLITELIGEQRAANEALAPFVTIERLDSLESRLAELLGEPPPDRQLTTEDGAAEGTVAASESDEVIERNAGPERAGDAGPEKGSERRAGRPGTNLLNR